MITEYKCFINFIKTFECEIRQLSQLKAKIRWIKYKSWVSFRSNRWQLRVESRADKLQHPQINRHFVCHMLTLISLYFLQNIYHSGYNIMFWKLTVAFQYSSHSNKVFQGNGTFDRQTLEYTNKRTLKSKTKLRCMLLTMSIIKTCTVRLYMEIQELQQKAIRKYAKREDGSEQ